MKGQIVERKNHVKKRRGKSAKMTKQKEESRLDLRGSLFI